MNEETVVGQDTEATPEAAPASQPPDWREWIKTVPPEELRHHPVIAGIAGQIGQTIAERQREQDRIENEKRKAQEVEEQLIQLANEDPLKFAGEFIDEKTRKRANDKLANLEADARAEYARRLGASYRQIPEFNELTANDVAKLTQALAGVPEEKVLEVWAVTAQDIISTKKAEKLAQSRDEKERAAEREAIRTEEAGKLLAKSPNPGVTAGRAAVVTDEPHWPSKEWDVWYERKHKR